MSSLEDGNMVADLVGVHAVEAIYVHSVANREAHGRDALFARSQWPVPVFDRAKLTDSERIHVEISLVMQVGQRIVGNIEPETEFIQDVLIERMHPLRGQVGNVRWRKDRKI